MTLFYVSTRPQPSSTPTDTPFPYTTLFRSTPQLQRFFYSHYFSGGLRQAVGVLLPALILAGVFQMHAIGMIAAIGAACVAIIDQPGGPDRKSTRLNSSH